MHEYDSNRTIMEKFVSLMEIFVFCCFMKKKIVMIKLN